MEKVQKISKVTQIDKPIYFPGNNKSKLLSKASCSCQTKASCQAGFGSDINAQMSEQAVLHRESIR